MMEEILDPELVAKEAAEFIRTVAKEQTGSEQLDTLLVLGTGWGETAELLGEIDTKIDTELIPGFTKTPVFGHNQHTYIIKYRTVKGEEKRALMFGSRIHLYERRGVNAVVHPIRVAAELGIKTVVLTNGAGGIKSSYETGTIAIITDHINFTGTTPLVGADFVDMTDVYSKRMRDIAKKVEPTLDEGVYVQFAGPQFETPAEIRMAKGWGGDIVGMSTALEAIFAKKMKLETFGVSLITDIVVGDPSQEPVSHEDINAIGEKNKTKASRILKNCIQNF
jgi:purine-nucleoside phosphorylase